MNTLSKVNARAASIVRVGTNAAVPAPTSAVDMSANKNVAVKVLRAYFSVWSRCSQATNRGENSDVPNWSTIKLTDVTKPVNTSMPLASADSADVALAGFMDAARTIGSRSSQRTRIKLKHSETSTYSDGTNQNLPTSRRPIRRVR